MKKESSESNDNGDPMFDDSDEEQVLEAGKINRLDDSNVRINPYAKLKFLTTRTLAYIIIIILTLSVLGHYMVTIYLLKSGQASIVNVTDRIFNTWLPVISGFAGAAVTYFFTKER